MRTILRPVLAVLAVVSLCGFGGLDALFAPKPDLWKRWVAHDPNSAIVVDHTPWESFLARYVAADKTGLNRIAYGQIETADSVLLAGYVAALGGVRVDALSRNQQLAYWINLYNALVVKLVLDHKPEKSIQDIDLASGLFSSGPWGAKLIAVEGEDLSLNDIEHRILRPIWNDPRLHYAVNCASVGCPNLQRHAFTAENMEAMLEDAARTYINHPRGVRLGPNGLVLSKIYAWFNADFGGSEDGVRAHLLKYATGETAARIKSGTEIAGFEYDWRLNAAVQ